MFSVFDENVSIYNNKYSTPWKLLRIISLVRRVYFLYLELSKYSLRPIHHISRPQKLSPIMKYMQHLKYATTTYIIQVYCWINIIVIGIPYQQYFKDAFIQIYCVTALLLKQYFVVVYTYVIPLMKH